MYYLQATDIRTGKTETYAYSQRKLREELRKFFGSRWYIVLTQWEMVKSVAD